MAKSLDDNFSDWEGHVFGFGYGTGELHTIPALRRFLELCPAEGGYDYRELEIGLGAAVAWLLINALAKYSVDMIEYGTSPRFGWLTKRGLALKAFMATKTDDELVMLGCRDQDYTHCYPDACNCGPDGYDAKLVCANPFWMK